MTTNHTQPNRFIRLPEVIHLIGLSRSQIYKMQGEGAFPRSVRLSERSVAWLEIEVLHWMDQRRRLISAACAS
jgi:prophage regulatory protein